MTSCKKSKAINTEQYTLSEYEHKLYLEIINPKIDADRLFKIAEHTKKDIVFLKAVTHPKANLETLIVCAGKARPDSFEQYAANERIAIAEKNTNSPAIKQYLSALYQDSNGSKTRTKEIFLPSRFQDGVVVYKHIDKIFYTLFERAIANSTGASFFTLANLNYTESQFLKERVEIVIVQLKNKPKSKWSCLFFCRKNKMTVESLTNFCKNNFGMQFNNSILGPTIGLQEPRM